MTQTPCNSMEHWNNLRLCVIWQQQADKVLHVENRCKFINYFWKTTRRTHSLLKRAKSVCAKLISVCDVRASFFHLTIRLFNILGFFCIFFEKGIIVRLWSFCIIHDGQTGHKVLWTNPFRFCLMDKKPNSTTFCADEYVYSCQS